MKYHGFDSRKGLVVCLFIFSGFYVAAASVIRRATNVANLNFKTLRFTCGGGVMSLSVFYFIIQQIVTMPIYGKEALNICHPT